MKVLWAGVFDGTGWGKAAIDYVLALDSVGVDVAPAVIKLSESSAPLPERIRELQGKSPRGCDVVVQHLPPSMYDFNGRMRNVALYATETSDFKKSGWADRINTMDAAIVINKQQVGASRRSGVAVPISVVPHATDITRFQRAYEPLDALKPYKEAGDFIFYTVGEFVRRKNWGALLKAFHLEFAPEEPVQLVLKSSKPGLSPEKARGEIAEVCSDIKRALKLPTAKPEVIITERLTDVGMLRLHAAGDCFVQTSHGEAWSIPAFDAMAMGKTPIVSACTGYLDYVSPETGWLVGGYEEPVFGVEDTFPGLFSGSELWFSPSITRLRRCMRECYENVAIRKEKSRAGVARSYDFSYGEIGAIFTKALLNQDA